MTSTISYLSTNHYLILAFIFLRLSRNMKKYIVPVTFILMTLSSANTREVELPGLSYSTLERGTIRSLQKHAGKLSLNSFRSEPVVKQFHYKNGSKQIHYYNADQTLLWSRNISDLEHESEVGEDTIIVGSVYNKFAIPTPRGAIKRQFVVLKQGKREWGQINEIEYYMSLVYTRNLNANESNKETIIFNGTKIIPEYDVWEERSQEFYTGWPNCDYTVLFTCDDNFSSGGTQGKRDGKDQDIVIVSNTTRVTRRTARPIKGLPGHDPEEYRDMFLDFDFHWFNELNEVIETNLEEVGDIQKNVGEDESLADRDEAYMEGQGLSDDDGGDPHDRKKRDIEDVHGSKRIKKVLEEEVGMNAGLTQILLDAKAPTGILALPSSDGTTAGSKIKGILLTADSEEELQALLGGGDNSGVLVLETDGTVITLKGLLTEREGGGWKYLHGIGSSGLDIRLQQMTTENYNPVVNKTENVPGHEEAIENTTDGVPLISSQDNPVEHKSDQEFSIVDNDKVNEGNASDVNNISSHDGTIEGDADKINPEAQILEGNVGTSVVNTEDVPSIPPHDKITEDGNTEPNASARRGNVQGRGMSGLEEESELEDSGSKPVVDKHKSLIGDGTLTLENGRISGVMNIIDTPADFIAHKKMSTNNNEEHAHIDNTTLKIEPGISIDLTGPENVDIGQLNLGRGIVGEPVQTSAAAVNGPLKLIGSEPEHLELGVNNIGSGSSVGEWNLKWISDYKLFMDSIFIDEQQKKSVWHMIDYDQINKAATNLSNVGMPLSWAKLFIIGLHISTRAQMFADIPENELNVGERVGTALIGTTLNGGLHRGQGFTGDRSITSNANVVFGTFYSGAGGNRWFFLPRRSIIRAEYIFGNSLSMFGYFCPDVKRSRDVFYPDNANFAKLFYNRTGRIIPVGFNSKKYKTGGIEGTLTDGNVVRTKSSKNLGVYDPNEDSWKNLLWMPRDIKHTEHALKIPLRHPQIISGNLPIKDTVNVKNFEETSMTMGETDEQYLSPADVKQGFVSWMDISWTQDARNGVLYNWDGEGKQLLLPLEALVRAEFKVGVNAEDSIEGFYFPTLPGFIDKFEPDDVIAAKKFYGASGKIFPHGYVDNPSKFGISGVLKEGGKFDCELQKVKTAIYPDQLTKGKASAPDGAMGVLYKIGDINIIMPYETSVKVEIKFEHNSILGEFAAQELGKLDKVTASGGMQNLIHDRVTIFPIGLNSKEPFMGISGRFLPKDLFKSDVVKASVVFDIKDEYWKDKVWIPTGTAGMLYEVEGKEHVQYLLPLLTGVRAEYKTPTWSVSGFFRSRGVDRPDWFYPDNEKFAKNLEECNGTIIFLGSDQTVGIPANLVDGQKVVTKSKKTKGLYNLEEFEHHAKVWTPMGSLGVLYKGAANRIQFFFPRGFSFKAAYSYENTSSSGYLTVGNVGQPDVFHPDDESTAQSLYGLSGKILPLGFNTTKKKLGIPGILSRGNLFWSQKIVGILNTKNKETKEKVWIPEGTKFERVGLDIWSDIDLMYHSWKEGSWADEDAITVIYQGENHRQIVVPKETLIRAQFRVKSKNDTIHGVFLSNEFNSTDVFFPDSEKSSKSLLGSKGEIIPIGPNPAEIKRGIKGMLTKHYMFQSEYQKVVETTKPKVPLWKGVFGISYAGAGEHKRFVLPIRTNIRAEFKLGNESHVGFFIPDEPHHSDMIHLDIRNPEKMLLGTKVKILPRGFKPSNLIDGIVGTLEEGNVFVSDKQKNKVLYDPNDSIWNLNVWAPDGALGIMYRVNGELQKLIFPWGVMIHMRFNSESKSITGLFLPGALNDHLDFFKPDDEEAAASLYGSLGKIVPISNNSDLGISGTFLKGGLFQSDVYKERLIFDPEERFISSDIWKPEGKVGALYSVGEKGGRIFLPIGLTRVQVKLKDTTIYGFMQPGHNGEPDHFFPRGQKSSQIWGGKEGKIIPEGIASTNGIEGVFTEGNIFVPTVKKSLVVYDPTDDIFKDEVLIAGENKNEAMKSEGSDEETSKLAYDFVNDGIPEGYPGLIYKAAGTGKRFFFVRGAMTRVKFTYNGTFSVVGNFLPTDTGRPDLFHPDIFIEDMNGARGTILPLRYKSNETEIGIKGVLWSDSMFLADSPKIDGLYDPYNAHWSSLMITLEGTVGMLYNKVNSSDEQQYLFPIGTKVRTEFIFEDIKVSGDFITIEGAANDAFYADDEALAETIYRKVGKMVPEGVNFSVGFKGVIKTGNRFSALTEKKKTLLDINDPILKRKVWVGHDELDPSEEQTKRFWDAQDHLLKDTSWALEDAYGTVYDLNGRDGLRQIFLPLETMIWSFFRVGEYTVFGFLQSDGVDQPENFVPDEEDLARRMIDRLGDIVPVGLYEGNSDYIMKATLKHGNQLLIESQKTSTNFKHGKSSFSKPVWVPEGSLGVLYDGTGTTKRFFFHMAALTRVEFKFGDESIFGNFYPVDPGRPDAFYPDEESAARNFYGQKGKVIPIGLGSYGRIGFHAVFRQGNLVQAEVRKIKIMFNPEDPIWHKKVVVAEGTLGILYNKPSDEKQIFLQHGTKVRAEFKTDEGESLLGFFQANVPGKPDDFFADEENEQLSLNGATGNIYLLGVKTNGGLFGIKGMLKGPNLFQTETTKVKAVYDPTDHSWQGKILTPVGNVGMLYEGAGHKRWFFFQSRDKIRAEYHVEGQTIWGFFQANVPGSNDFFYPDDDNVAKSVYGFEGTIIPEGFKQSVIAKGIIGILLEGNEFWAESKKMKGLYDPTDTVWRKRVWTPRKDAEKVLMYDRHSVTLEGKKILYGYLFQGIEQSPHMFIAEGDSISGIFLPQSKNHPNLKKIPHGVLTPTHPAGHAFFVADYKKEVEFIKEVWGVFLPDALGFTAGFSGTLSLVPSANARFSFVLDKPATEFVYVVGSASVKDVWSIYMNQNEWKFDVPEINTDEGPYSIKRLTKRLAKPEDNDIPSVNTDLGAVQNVKKEGKQDLKHVAGLKITTRRTIAFIPFNFTIIGVITLLENFKEIVSYEVDFTEHETDVPINIKKSGLKALNGKGTFSALFTPQNFPEGDAIVCKFKYDSSGETGKLLLYKNMEKHVWNKNQDIWVPVGFREKMDALEEDEEHEDGHAEKNAKDDWSSDHPFNLDGIYVPGVLNKTHDPWQRPRNFKFGPLYPEDLPQMEENYIAKDDLHHEYIYGYYIKAIESPEPIFVPDTGIRGKFTPLTQKLPMHDPATGFYFPDRPNLGSRFLLEDGYNVSVGVKGKFQIFNARGILSKGFFYAYLGIESLLFSGQVEIVGGWEMMDLPRVKGANLPRYRSNMVPELLVPSKRRLKYALVDVGGGFKGVFVEGKESIEDPNNPLFQEYLHYRAQRDGDVNPWGRVGIVDPIVRNESKKLRNGYFYESIKTEGSMVHSLMLHFSLKSWEEPRLSEYSHVQGSAAKLEPLRLGERINVVNLLEFRMFLFAKYSLKRAYLGKSLIWIYVPLQAEPYLTVVRKAKPNLKWVGNVEKRFINRADVNAADFSAYTGIDYRSLKSLERKRVGEGIFKVDLKSDMKNALFSNWGNVSQCDTIQLGPFQTMQILAVNQRAEVVRGMDLGFELVSNGRTDWKISDVSKKLLQLLEIKRARMKDKFEEEPVSKGRSLLGGTNEEMVLVRQNITEEVMDDREQTKAQMLPGWKIQYRNVEPNASLSKPGVVFYGLGNCEQNSVPDIKLWDNGDVYGVLDYFLKVMRVDCQKNVKDMLLNLINEEFLKFDEKTKFFRIPKRLPVARELKLTHEQMRKLSVAFEFHAVTRTYYYIRLRGYLKEYILKEPYCTISRSTAFLTELSFYMITRAPQMALRHSIRLVRNLLATLRTVLTKLQHDALTLKECNECSFDRTVTAGDKFRIVSLIQFIINGMGPYHKGQMLLKPAFKAFVNLNEKAIRDRVAMFEKQFSMRKKS